VSSEKMETEENVRKEQKLIIPKHLTLKGIWRKMGIFLKKRREN
jgi:hypothetical protein